MAGLVIICKAALFAVLLAFYFGIPAYGVQEAAMGDTTNSFMQQDTVVITGRIFVTGHEPFTVLAIEREDGSAVVISADDPLYKELWSYQNKTLQCKGKYIPDPLHGQAFYVINFQKGK